MGAAAAGGDRGVVGLGAPAVKGTRVRVRYMGIMESIEYRRGARGRTYRHRFTGSSAKVYATRDGRTLVIAPVRVTKWIEE